MWVWLGNSELTARQVNSGNILNSKISFDKVGRVLCEANLLGVQLQQTMIINQNLS